MKIFNIARDYEKDIYYSKVNFVDDSNVLVGYDTDQCCCEDAGYFISDKEENENKNDNGISDGLDGYVFDKSYFAEVVPKRNEYGSCLDCGGMVRFKLVCNGKPDLYLHLFNVHNGYYGHGFEFKMGDLVLKKGDI